VGRLGDQSACLREFQVTAYTSRSVALSRLGVSVVAKGLPADFYKSRTFFFVFLGGGVLSIGFGTAQEISLFFFFLE